MELTQELVREWFEYKDGELFWKKRPSSRAAPSDCAGNINNKGRYSIGLLDKNYLRSRLIFLWHYGYLPEIIDHKDRNKLNDRIENLREATISQNAKNRTSKKNSSSQYLGVYFQISKVKVFIKSTNSFKICIYKKWAVMINANGKYLTIGRFNTEKEAALAYNKAAVKHHGEFANLNIIKPND